MRTFAQTAIRRFELADLDVRDVDGRDDAGQAVASGLYLCRMKAGEYNAVRKLLLVR